MANFSLLGPASWAFRLGKLFNISIDMMIGVMKPLAEYICSEIPSGYVNAGNQIIRL